MVDETMRKLKVPPKFIGYLEKHKIYELFHSVATQLVLEKPDRPDCHLVFIKNALTALKASRNKPKIIIIAAPHFDRAKLAQRLCEELDILPVTFCNVVRSDPENREALSNPVIFAEHTAKLLRLEPYLSTGWLLVDFPKDLTSAAALQKAGIIPTRVLHLHPSNLKPTKKLMRELDKDYYDLKQGILDDIKKYRLAVPELRNIYRHIIKDVDVRNMDVDEASAECARQLRLMPHLHPPMLPRVLLIGMPGSGRKTQAKMLAQRFGLVHVDFEQIMARARACDGELGDHLRLLYQQDREPNSSVETKVLEARLQEWDCMSKGWVLTGYPRQLSEMRHLDTLDMPPNRVVLLEATPKECYLRLSGRRYNILTGARECPDHVLAAARPDDRPSRVAPRVERVRCEMENMVRYCGGTATRVNGLLNPGTVFELVSATVVRPSPSAPARQPFAPLAPDRVLEAVAEDVDDQASGEEVAVEDVEEAVPSLSEGILDEESLSYENIQGHYIGVKKTIADETFDYNFPRDSFRPCTCDDEGIPGEYKPCDCKDEPEDVLSAEVDKDSKEEPTPGDAFSLEEGVEVVSPKVGDDIVQERGHGDVHSLQEDLKNTSVRASSPTESAGSVTDIDEGADARQPDKVSDAEGEREESVPVETQQDSNVDAVQEKAVSPELTTLSSKNEVPPETGGDEDVPEVAAE